MMTRESGNGKQHCRCQCHWDLSWLRFGDTRIAASDVDGLFVIERNCRFLFIETKKLHEPLSRGQAILLHSLSRVRGFNVLVLRGDRSEPVSLTQFVNGFPQAEEPTDRARVQQRVDAWFEEAERRP